MKGKWTAPLGLPELEPCTGTVITFRRLGTPARLSGTIWGFNPQVVFLLTHLEELVK